MPFARPTTTATPDEIFEEWVHVLSHAELLALLYVVRRTLGFKKDADSISYTQFLHGIVTREGKVLDRGCGIRSRTTLAAALRRLEERGLIRSYKTQDTKGDNATTRYSLWFAGDDDQGATDRAAVEGQAAGDDPTAAPLRGSARIVPPQYAERTTGSAPTVPPVVRGSYPQQTVETTNTRQQTVLSKRKGAAHHATALDSTDSTTSAGDLISMATTGDSPSSVAAAVADLSAEFGDDAPQASRTRVANMQRVAGLADADVLPLLDEAAAIARSQTAAITKRGRGGEIVRMPYLLATLRDLVDASDMLDAPLASGAGRPDPRLSGTGPGSGVTSAGAPAWPAPAWPAPAGPCAPGGGATAAVAGDDPPADSAATALWRAVLGEVREVLTPENYAVWFAPACALALEGDVLRVAVPSPFHADWLAHKLGGRVRQALERTGHGGVRIAYDVAAAGGAHRRMRGPWGERAPPAAPRPVVAGARSTSSARSHEAPRRQRRGFFPCRHKEACCERGFRGRGASADPVRVASPVPRRVPGRIPL